MSILSGSSVPLVRLIHRTATPPLSGAPWKGAGGGGGGGSSVTMGVIEKVTPLPLADCEPRGFVRKGADFGRARSSVRERAVFGIASVGQLGELGVCM